MNYTRCSYTTAENYVPLVGCDRGSFDFCRWSGSAEAPGNAMVFVYIPDFLVIPDFELHSPGIPNPKYGVVDSLYIVFRARSYAWIAMCVLHYCTLFSIGCADSLV